MSYTEWQMFDSSSIAAGRYDPDSKVLEIQFNEGKIYKYVDVPRDIWLGLCRADSNGDFFHSHINNRFQYGSNTKSTKQETFVKEKKTKHSFYELDFLEVQEFALQAMQEKNWERAAVSWERLEQLIDQKVKCHRATAYCRNNIAVCWWWFGEREKAYRIMCNLHEYVKQNWSFKDADSGELNNTGENRQQMKAYLEDKSLFTKPNISLTFIEDCFFNSTIPDQVEEEPTTNFSSRRITPKETPSFNSEKSSSGCSSVIVIGILTVASLYFI